MTTQAQPKVNKMSWEDIVKKDTDYSYANRERKYRYDGPGGGVGSDAENFGFQEQGADDDREDAIVNLQEDIENVIRELEELEAGDSFETFYDRLDNMKTSEIKKLSDALGQVSVLLQ